MPSIKKLVMYGFKSFARKTELPLTSDINVVIGPNGAGKSNVTDALCFVLGRLSAKSMRAAKSSNMIFSGTAAAGPAKEAIVEIIFNNADNSFMIPEAEVSIKRILRKNGQSIYRINGKTRTRQEVLTLLARAGIDPNGFNIILQNEIQNFATGLPEDRRKIIEEVAGISIYESRKEKSLRELKKTSDKLKEVEAVLRERTSYLDNLEREKEVALKKKKLEFSLKKLKKSIIYGDLEKKKKEAIQINKQIEDKSKEIEKYRKNVLTLQTNIENLEEKIAELNSEIQKQTGFEQEYLNKEISDLRADVAVAKVKIESHEKKKNEIGRQKNNLKKIVEKNEATIDEMKKESPTVMLIQKELGKKKKELDILEEQRKKYYMTKMELKSSKERLDDKNKILQNYENESNFLMKQINNLTSELYDRKTVIEMVDKLRHKLTDNKDVLSKFNIHEREIEKIINVNEAAIAREKKTIEKIEKIDICPLCQSKITNEHIKKIEDKIKPKIKKLEKEIFDAENEFNDIKEKREILNEDIDKILSEIQKRQSDLIKLKNIHDKEDQVKILHEKTEFAKNELKTLENKTQRIETDFDEDSTIEEKYETVKMEVQDISIRNKENLDSDIQFKQKELDRAIISIKQLIRNEEDLDEEIIIIQKSLNENEKKLSIKKNEEEELRSKADKFIKERDKLHHQQREFDRSLSIEKNKIHNVETSNNNLRVDKAKVDAQIQGFETDILEFQNIEIIKANREQLVHRQRKTEEILSKIGTVNMRALEIYEEVKKEYEKIRDKVETIKKENEKIMKIIHRIDIEKKKVFLRTVEELNIKFKRNFSQISNKGEVYLEIQNKKDPFEAGIDVILKTGHGKYFDIKSLSGGEKTMVALSLIFAIQEFKPYCFYILDEIDAALDKRNASRLAEFLKKYVQKGQYIVISHNDEIISNAQTLFGVSMHEGISKLTALKV